MIVYIKKYFLLLLLLFSGCTSQKSDVVTVKFWAIGAEGEKVALLVPEFERLNPGIKIIVQQIPWTAAHEKLITAYASETLPDVFQIGNTWVAEFSQLDAAEPLNPYILNSKTIKKENYFEGVWDANVINGNIFSIPWYVDTRVMFYRKDLLEKAGYNEFPKTWDEFFEAGKKIISQKGDYAIFMPTNEWQPYTILGAQKGSSFLKANDTYGNFNEPKFISAMKFLEKMYKEKVALHDMQKVLNVYQSFGAGYFAFYITGPWNVIEMNKNLPENLRDKWMTAPMPSFDSSYPGLSSAGGASLIVSRTSKNKEAAFKWIEFLSENKTQLEFYKLVSSLPAVKNVWDDPILNSNKYMAAFHQQLEKTKPDPKVPEWEQIVFEKLKNKVEYIARGEMSVETAMRTLDNEVNSILEKRRWLIETGKIK